MKMGVPMERFFEELSNYIFIGKFWNNGFSTFIVENKSFVNMTFYPSVCRHLPCKQGRMHRLSIAVIFMLKGGPTPSFDKGGLGRILYNVLKLFPYIL